MSAVTSRPGPLSVVIPSRDRPAILERTVAALVELRGEVEALDLIVVDDGSRRPASPPAAPSEPALRCRHLRLPPSGPAAARNRGIAEALHERVLLLGDDTRPAAGCLARHAAAAGGLQGRIDWDPRQPPTPVMRFLAPAGPQYWFVGLKDGGILPFTALLGSNYSAPRAWFLAEPFDEGFPDAAFEDTELAWRFRKRGFVSRYAAAALCWHDHPYESLEPFIARQERAGRAARYAVERHPALAWWALVKPLVLDLARRAGVSALAPPVGDWDRRCRRAYLRGFFRRSGDLARAEAR